MRSRGYCRMLALAFILISSCLSLLGQGAEGRILGTIVDQSGGSIPGAMVSVTDADRGVTRQLMTDAAGAFSAPNLQPGNYTIKVEFMGFRNAERKDVSLSVGAELKVDFTMQPGEQAQTITVTGEVAQINTTSAVLGGSLGPGTIQDLPLNGRNFMNLLSLRPGVTVYPGGGAWTQTTNGLRPEHNIYILDGITAIEPLGGQSTINSVSLAGDTATLLPIDVIQEFATQQNAKAEFGWKPGSITSIALKSGTNAFHGTLNAFGRTDVTDARNAFLGVDPLTGGAQKQNVQLKNYGGTIGGPIKKDKLFFYAAYEGQRYEVSNPGSITFPTTAEAITACNTARTTPGTQLSATSLKITGLDANCTRTAGYSIFDLDPSSFSRINGSRNVAANLATNYGVDGGMGKVDYNINDKHSLNAKYFYGTHAGLVVNSGNITQPYWRPTDSAWVHFFGSQWNYIASSALFNTLRFGYNRFYQTFETTDCAGGGGAPTYGVPFGFGDSKPNCGFTNVSIQGYNGGIGCCASFPKYYGPDNIFEIIEGLSYLKGKHSLKVGGEYRNSQSAFGGGFNRGRGQVTFTNLTNFYNGVPNANGQIFIGEPRRNIRQKAYAAYFQDDWKLMPRLTINLGLRYEYLSPLSEGDNKLSNFIPGTGFTQLGVNGVDSMWNPDKNNFAPRFGFAWDMFGDGKTVLRGGSTMMYVTPGWWMFLSQQNTNNPSAGLNTNPSGFLLCKGAVNTSGPGCAAGVATDPTIGSIQSAGLPLPGPGANGIATAGQVNWNQTAGVYGGNVYPSSSDTSVLKCGTNRFCTAQATNPNLKNAYVYSWSLGIQRQINTGLALDVNYVGNHATKLIGMEYTNTPAYGAGYCIGFTPAQRTAAGNCPATITAATGTSAAAIQLARPLNAQYPYLSYIYTVANPYFSNYHGLQTALTQRPVRGLNYTLGFTWAHAIDQSTGERGGPTGLPGNFRQDYSSSDFDIRKRFTATMTYALPSKNGFGQMLKGWRLTSIVTMQSALPWGTIGARGNDPAGIAEFQDRWNFKGSASDFSGLGRDAVPYIAPAAAINTPACVAQTGGPGSLSYISLQKWGCYVNGGSVMTPPAIGSAGNMGRNTFRGNPIGLWDASIMKEFKFGERVTTQFRIEAFNILNKVMYGNPQFNGVGGNDAFGNPSAFGSSQSTPDVANNNPSLGSGGPRAFQFGLKINF